MPTIGDAWITENLAAALTIASVPEEDALISALIQAVYAHSNTPAEKSINWRRLLIYWLVLTIIVQSLMPIGFTVPQITHPSCYILLQMLVHAAC
ncbi:MAG: hypothetical protein M5U34_36570 [Chloroflexi bacterium]|nr:hypothetical protein [Chloroflexota bacterium]